LYICGKFAVAAVRTRDNTLGMYGVYVRLQCAAWLQINPKPFGETGYPTVSGGSVTRNPFNWSGGRNDADL